MGTVSSSAKTPGPQLVSEVRILLNELNHVHLHWPSLLLGFWSDLDPPGHFTEVTSLSKR